MIKANGLDKVGYQKGIKASKSSKNKTGNMERIMNEAKMP